MFSMFSTRNPHFCVTVLISIITCAKPEKCPDLPKLTILPGLGWDALANNDMKQLMETTYEQCKLTLDGKFLIPDNLVAVAVQGEERQVEAEIFDHWSHYIAPTSASFRVATEIWPKQFLPLYYSFSKEYQEVKKLQVKNNAFTCRSQLRQVMYRIVISSDSRMAVGVKEKFQQVITALVRNNTEEAKHRVETIVSIYGTHFSKSVDVGVVFAKEDYLRDYFLRINNDDRSKILSASKLSLLELASVSWKNKQYFDSSLSSEYNDAILEKKIRHFGGLNWEKDSVAQCMVAVDKSGDLLSGLITASNFPRAQSFLLSNVRQMFSDVIQDYYVQNIHRGCTRPKSSNFEYIANLDDDSCDSSEVYDYVFGGFFVTNEVRSYGVTNDWSSAILKNPLTESTSCPTQFETSIVYTRMSYRMYSSYYHASVKQQFVSCLANESLGTSYLFGGLYSSDVNNIHTNDKSCPPFYSAISVDAQMGSLSICVNNSDNSFAKRYALPFGGFASASNKYQCPIGYKKYLAMNFNATDPITKPWVFRSSFRSDREIYYCLHEPNVKDLGKVPLLIRPPFAISSNCSLKQIEKK